MLGCVRLSVSVRANIRLARFSFGVTFGLPEVAVQVSVLERQQD